MKSSANSPSSRSKQRRRSRAAINSKVQANKVEKRGTKANKSTKERATAPQISKGLNIKNSFSEPGHSSKHWPFELQATPPHPHQQSRVDSLSPTSKGRLELEFPPPLNPLTEQNLREHTQYTNPGETPLAVMTSSGTIVSQSKSDLHKLGAYGVVILEDNEPWPDAIDQFLREFVERKRSDETPGAEKLHRIQPRAKAATSESTTAEMIAVWLMFRDEGHPILDGEEFISLCNEINLNRLYVQHADRPELNLAQPRPDRINGYVSRLYANGVLTSPFTEEEETILREYMVPVIHEEALFAWLTAEFKSAKGKSLLYGIWQSGRAGVAANNYMREFLAKAGIVATEQDMAHFSLACDAESAVLYVHWIGDGGCYYMKRVYKADLHSNDRHEGKSEQMVQMRKCLRNILDWAKGHRLKKIKNAIRIVKEHRDAVEEAATKRAEAGAQRKARQSQSSNSLRTQSGSSSATIFSGNSRGRNQQPPARSSVRLQPPQAAPLSNSMPESQGPPRRSPRLHNGNSVTSG